MAPVCLKRQITSAPGVANNFGPTPAKVENYHGPRQVVYGIACPEGCTHTGEIVYSRWREVPLPETITIADGNTALEIRPDVFGYEPTTVHGLVEWYLNFAHHDLFCAYGGPLLAQDELQVAEHPALGSLREALLDYGEPFGTVEDGMPTPVLIRNVERRCVIDTQPNLKEGRPYGLYGNNFYCASREDIVRAVKPIVPPTVSNVIAIEAPAYGESTYTFEEVSYILTTAFSGFAAARQESLDNGAQEVAIHTGFWGCGAYGGNRMLMTILQLLAANLAQIEHLVFHTVDENGAYTVQQALILFDVDFCSGTSRQLSELIDQVIAYGFEWGESDGN